MPTRTATPLFLSFLESPLQLVSLEYEYHIDIFINISSIYVTLEHYAVVRELCHRI